MRIPNRRSFLMAAATATSLMSRLGHHPTFNRPVSNSSHFCAFIKFIQELGFDELSTTIAELGYNGIEGTIRPKGLIEPEQAKAELPKLVNALEKNGIEMSIMTSAINQADRASRELLSQAADLGIKRFRMAYYRYDLKKPILDQLDNFRRQAIELGEFCQQVGMTALYQNHAGARYVGSTVWDLEQLLKDIDPNHMAVAFDIRHATATGGKSWPVYWNLIKERVRSVYIKDFRWEGLQTVNVPLGEGVVEKRFFDELSGSGFEHPISLHVEYLQKSGLQPNIDALGTDLKSLKNLLS